MLCYALLSCSCVLLNSSNCFSIFWWYFDSLLMIYEHPSQTWSIVHCPSLFYRPLKSSITTLSNQYTLVPYSRQDKWEDIILFIYFPLGKKAATAEHRSVNLSIYYIFSRIMLWQMRGAFHTYGESENLKWNEKLSNPSIFFCRHLSLQWSTLWSLWLPFL